MRVVLDTNIIVSQALTSRGSIGEIFSAWQQKRFDLVVSEEILEEYHEALQRPSTLPRYKKSAKDIAALVRRLRHLSLVVSSSERIDVVKGDPDDNKFIECAIAGEAEYIISGDSDLLAVKAYQGIHILSPAQFLMALKEHSRTKKAA